MAENRQTGKLAVILHADIAGSTALVQQDEQIAHERIQDAFRRFSETIKKYHGSVCEIRGDALLAEFDRPSDSVTAALAFQADQMKLIADFTDDVRPEVRVGIAMGEVIIADNTVTGAGVVLAQRVEQLAEPGHIRITAAVHEGLPKRLPFDLIDKGEQKLKGFDEFVRVYSVELREGESIPPPVVIPHPWATPKHARPALFAVIIASIIAAVLLGWWKPWLPKEEPASMARMSFPLPDKPSIAVLPFSNMSNDKEQEYFVDGMTDDLITDLSKLSGLFVIARNSVFTYKDKAVKIGQVAEELGVRYVLEGSVRGVENKIRINAQLIDATTGGHVWAERYDSDEADIFKLQDRVTKEIVAALQVKLTDSESERLARLPTSNLEAYDYYQRAKQLSQGFGVFDEGKAIKLYKEAIALDPGFGGAYAELGFAALNVWRFGADNVMPGPVARKLAYESASKAFETDPENSTAFSVLALLQAADGHHEQALASANQAIDLLPGNPWAYVHLASVQVIAGRPSEAQVSMETAARLDPKSPPWYFSLLGRVLFFNRQYEQAIQSMENGVKGGAGYLRLLAMAHAQLNRAEEAKNYTNQLLKIVPFESIARTKIRSAHFKRDEDIELIIDSLRKAGVPEWPFGFVADEKNLLDDETINSITIGRTWTGYSQNGGKFVQQFTSGRQVALRNAGSLLTGTAWDEDGMLCIQYSALDMGRASCGFLFRNPGGTIEKQNEYIYLNSSDVSYFSVKQ